jgi:hypothetical protein
MKIDWPQKDDLFRHKRGNLYVVLGIGRHSETLEDLVIYKRADDSDKTIWVRPLSIFTEKGRFTFEGIILE